MGRAPCCEKMGLKKGPWTPEEDRILIDYINSYGHSNWRALPKHAGLLRCGKSCRLRWINYLRPDIKRGNFTTQEEQAIINLHQMLGNRWSAIAARLPGRTDNEIKNVWHTHLKKRLPQHQQSQDTIRKSKQQTKLDNNYSDAAAKQEQQQQLDTTHETKQDPHDHMPLSPPQCSSSDISTLTTSSDDDNNNINHHHDNISNNNDNIDSPDGNDLALDEDFWSEVLSADNSCETTTKSDNFPSATIIGGEIDNDEFQFSSMCDDGDGMDFWYDVYARAEELTEFLEL